METVLKNKKIKETHEYQMLERLKKLWVLFSCSGCQYGYNCCDKCEESDGYLRYRIEGEEYPSAFLEKGKGCKLPIQRRSVMCLTFMCDEKKATMDTDYLDGLAALLEVMRKLEFDIYLMDLK